jgi:flavin reductase (DIM6/NTAB) family NADH-FMN oxidoreductase RutF
MMTKVFSEQAILQLPSRVRANFINSLSGFKSANLVGTRSSSGVNNLATVSSVFHVGAHPPLLGMLMRPHTVVRDTLQNIKDTGVYTINHVHYSFADKAHQCSARYLSEQSEFDAVGLNPQLSSVVTHLLLLSLKSKLPYR